MPTNAPQKPPSGTPIQKGRNQSPVRGGVQPPTRGETRPAPPPPPPPPKK